MKSFILIGFVGALCLLPLVSATPAAAQTIKFVTTDTVTAVNDKATLPDGVTLELLGVTDSDKNSKTKPAVWWKADATPLAAPLYAQTVADADFNRSKSSLFDHILTFSFKVSGLKVSALADSNVRMTQALVKHSFMTGGAVNISVPHSANGFCYEVHTGFGRTKRPGTTSLRLKIARGSWQTEATVTAQPSVVHVSDALTVTFDKPDKGEAGTATHRKEFSIGKRGTPAKTSELAVIVRFEKSQTEDDVDRRVIVMDDQGKIIPLGGSDSLVYGPDQTGKPEIHLLVTIPETLRGHIRQYQLQTRSYQYVDFPNIALKPKTEAQPRR